MVTAEFGRLREFLLEEEERIKVKLQRQKEQKLKQLEEALTETTEQISQMENIADELRLKLTEEENPEQLKVWEKSNIWCSWCLESTFILPLIKSLEIPKNVDILF